MRSKPQEAAPCILKECYLRQESYPRDTNLNSLYTGAVDRCRAAHLRLQMWLPLSPLGTASTAAKHRSLCLRCPSAESCPALGGAQLNGRILGKGFSALCSHGHCFQILLRLSWHQPRPLEWGDSSGSFWIGSLLRAEPPSPLWSPQLRCHPQWAAHCGSHRLYPVSVSPRPQPPSWLLRCLGPFCLAGPEGELPFP